MDRREVASVTVGGLIQKTGWGEWRAAGKRLHAIDFSSSYTDVDKVLSEAIKSWEKLYPHCQVKNVKLRRIHPRLWRFCYERHRKDSVFPFN